MDVRNRCLLQTVVTTEVEVEVNLRPTVSPWLLWEGPEAIVQVNYRPVLSSERALQNNKVASLKEISRRKKNWPYFTVSSKTPPTWRARFPYLYPPRTGRHSYTPGHWITFLSPLTSSQLKLIMYIYIYIYMCVCVCVCVCMCGRTRTIQTIARSSLLNCNKMRMLNVNQI
jgi:hypothetical protein